MIHAIVKHLNAKGTCIKRTTADGFLPKNGAMVEICNSGFALRPLKTYHTIINGMRIKNHKTQD
jgi:hypothetical protein